MAKIHILSPQIANMIAAGEVVERPASVVKELVENAIDAQATYIHVALKQSGKLSILVEDDGHGMEQEDAVLAFTRHATSKIHTKQDLFQIRSLGFRGEALPSIASVSQVTLLTSTGQSAGTKLVLHPNQPPLIRIAPSKKGTAILVENLFYNTPARLKHLKSDTTELGHVIEVVTKLAMGYPHIVFRLSHHDQILFQSSGRGDILEVIATAYGSDFAKELIPVSFESVDFKVSGYIGKNYVHRPSRKSIQAFLNHRPIRLPLLYSLLQQVYQTWLPPERFPIAFLYIEADYQLVDINVHPSKNEVRLSKDDVLSTLLKTGLQAALNQEASAPKVAILQKEIPPPLRYESEELPLFYRANTEINPAASYVMETTASDTARTPKPLPSLRAVGQIHGTYLVAQSEIGFYVIDQHAAVERIQFERLSKLYETTITTSELLLPFVIERSQQEMLLLKEKLDVFQQLGIHLEIFGHNALRVTHVPTWIKQENIDDYFHALIEEILQGKDTFLHLRTHSIATLACHSSLKSNRYLTLEAMQELIDTLLTTNNPYNCPHGRPTMIFYSTYELEKLFKRTGF